MLRENLAYYDTYSSVLDIVYHSSVTQSHSIGLTSLTNMKEYMKLLALADMCDL